MKLREFPLLLDENIFRLHAIFLRDEGFDVKSVVEEGWQGRKDIELIPIAFSENRVILTQDNDFGQIVFTQKVDFVGIVFLRPGHYPPEFHIETLQAILENDPDLEPPFMLTAENKKASIRIRLRIF